MRAAQPRKSDPGDQAARFVLAMTSLVVILGGGVISAVMVLLLTS